MKTRTNTFKPQMEALESRNLMTGSFTWDASLGLITIRGNATRNNQVLVTVANDNVHVSLNYTDGSGQFILGPQMEQSNSLVKKIRFLGGSGNDRFTNATDKVSVAYGYAGNDSLAGGSNNDLLYGGSGDDQLMGRQGDDWLMGEDGNDTYIFRGTGFLGSDTIIERDGADYDTLDFSLMSRGVAVDLYQTSIQTVAKQLVTLDRGPYLPPLRYFVPVLQLTLTNSAASYGNGIERVLATGFDDLIKGNGRNNILDGRDGNDVLVGRQGNDALFGGNGNDVLIGGWGSDWLEGGNAQDILIGGTTPAETDMAQLSFIMAEWQRTDIGYMDRVQHLTGETPGGWNGSVLLNAQLVGNDEAGDMLQGGNNVDWFLARFAALPDRLPTVERNF